MSKNQIIYVVASFCKHGLNVSKKNFCNDKNDGERWKNSYGIMIGKHFDEEKVFELWLKTICMT